MTMKRNLNFLGLSNCSFESHITQTQPNASSILHQKMGFDELLPHPPYRLYMNHPVLQQANNIFTGASGNIYAEKYCLEFCCQQLKHGSNQHCWILTTYHCRTPNSILHSICILRAIGQDGQIKDEYQLSVTYKKLVDDYFFSVLRMLFLQSVSETSFLDFLKPMLRGQQKHVKISLGQM